MRRQWTWKFRFGEELCKLDGYSTYVETITTTFWGKYAVFWKKTLTFLLPQNINKKLQVPVKYKKHDQWTLWAWDWTNRTLISLWHCRNNGRYPAERNPPGSYTTSVSTTIMSILYCGNWKLKCQDISFSVAATKNF